MSKKRAVSDQELDALDAGALPCIEVRPGTLGFQLCWRMDGHDGPHISQDLNKWAGKR